jgi:hypothetical protein
MTTFLRDTVRLLSWILTILFNLLPWLLLAACINYAIKDSMICVPLAAVFMWIVVFRVVKFWTRNLHAGQNKILSGVTKSHHRLAKLERKPRAQEPMTEASLIHAANNLLRVKNQKTSGSVSQVLDYNDAVDRLVHVARNFRRET